MSRQTRQFLPSTDFYRQAIRACFHRPPIMYLTDSLCPKIASRVPNPRLQPFVNGTSEASSDHFDERISETR
jgi:hypothetical protein